MVQGDLAFLDGGDPCSRESQSELRYACFRADREQYLGAPEPGTPADFALSYGTTRIALHIERPIIDNVTLGGRFGFAFGGGPTPARGPAFLPLHLEARIAYFIGKPLSAERGVRGVVSVMGGLAQVDAFRSVAVRECGADSKVACTPATNLQPGGPNPQVQSLEAYKKLGQGFIGLGLGAYYSFLPASGVLLELRIMQLFPGTGTTFSPSLSYVFNVP